MSGERHFKIRAHPGIVDFISSKFDVLLAEGGDVTIANVLWNGYTETPDKFATVVMSVLTSIELTIHYGAERAGITDPSELQAGFIAKQVNGEEFVDLEGGEPIVTALRSITTFVNGDTETLGLVVATALEKGPEYCHEYLTCLVTALRGMVAAETDPAP